MTVFAYKTLGITVALLGVSACATHNFGDVAPPPPPPPVGGAVLADWRGIISSADLSRYQRLDRAWALALEQANRLKGSGDFGSLGRVINPKAGLSNPQIPSGLYRCRMIKLGSQGSVGTLGYVVYDWFDCRVDQTSRGQRLTKTTGSQRQDGLLYPEDNNHMVFLGAMALSSEPAAPAYGERRERDLVSVLERIGDRHWRLVTPWPNNESNLDVLEVRPR